MKKTLAAVLAAAMALSTASVAFAVDHPVDDEDVGLVVSSGSDDIRDTFRYGKDIHHRIERIESTDGAVFDGWELADWVDDGFASVSVTVTEGASKLASKPSITQRNYTRTISTSDQTTTGADIYTWSVTLQNADGTNTRVVKGKRVADVPVFDNDDPDNNPATDDGHWTSVFSDPAAIDPVPGKADTWRLKPGIDVQWMDKSKDASYGLDYDDVLDNGVLTKYMTRSKHELTGPTTNTRNDNLLRMTFRVADTYGTGDTTVGMKIRITIKKDIRDAAGTLLYKKGDTYTTDELKWKVNYLELTQYTHDMQLTLPEVDERYVKLKASGLYDEIGADTFTIAFEDVAVFEAKLSAGQKDVNLYYDVDEKTAITDEYPDVDFEFITFRGNPSFVNSGTMTFNAIGGKNTVVYTFDGEALEPLDSKTTYDSTYDTVVVKGVKRLGTFVIASEALEVEDDEDNEPVNSAPVVEEPSSSEAPSNDGERNPSTGAC